MVRGKERVRFKTTDFDNSRLIPRFVELMQGSGPDISKANGGLFRLLLESFYSSAKAVFILQLWPLLMLQCRFLNPIFFLSCVCSFEELFGQQYHPIPEHEDNYERYHYSQKGEGFICHSESAVSNAFSLEVWFCLGSLSQTCHLA